MYTICTGCGRQFRILAEQLSAAHGQVKCGYCGTQFDALIHLSDKPSKPPVKETSTTSTQDDVTDTDNHMSQDASVQNESIQEAPEQETIALKEAEESQEELIEFSFQLPEQDSDTSEVIDHQDTQAEPSSVYSFTTNDKEATSSQQIDAKGEDDLSDAARQALESGKVETTGKPQEGFEFPEQVILNEPKPRKRFWPIVFWTLGCLLLLLVFAGQYIWFQRDELLQRYPQYYPYAIQFCEKLECQIQRVENLQAIQVLNRDVRLHPAYRDTLLVNATIVNKATQPMRFPVIQLTLFNTGGEVISFRTFQPDDYLDQSIDKEQGMLPEQPIHFALELTGEIDNAVSFEFDFL